ncbi:MAG: YbfB/YjiJ family MFS transporter [Vulcanimicrobiaceae bacterium]
MWIRVGAAGACFAAIMGFSRLAYGLLVPAMAHALGGSYALYGAIGSANFVGYLVGTLLATRLARLARRSRTNAIALVAMCLAMAACGIVREPVALTILRFVVGVTSGSALALTLALAVEGVAPARRGVAAAIVWGGGSLGIALVGAAAIAVPASARDAWRVQWIAMAFLGLVFTAVFARLTRERTVAEASDGASAAGQTERPADAATPLGLFARTGYLRLTIGYFVYGAGYIDIVTFFGATLDRAHAFPSAAAWLVLGTAGIAGVAVWGPLVDRLRSGVPVALACACCALGAAAVATERPVLAIVGALAIGVSFIGVPAMVGALVQQRESAQTYGRAFASITVVLGVGQIVGPALGGLVADRFGPGAALFVGSALLFVAAASTAGYRATRPQSCDAGRPCRVAATGAA